MPDSAPDQPVDLLTISEAAALLRAPVATLRYWRHRGTGPRSFRLGRRVLYRRDDLEAWVDAQRTQESPDLAARVTVAAQPPAFLLRARPGKAGRTPSRAGVGRPRAKEDKE
jgi:excisionase family DNA binding protein